MFELADFYNACRETGVDVIPFMGMPAAGASVRDQGNYAIFLDIGKIQSTRLLRGVCCHELGHVATGALHKIDSPFETVGRSEYRANRYVAERFLTPEDFREAFALGCTQLWQLAEFFELPEEDVRRAYDYWVQAKGVDFNN